MNGQIHMPAPSNRSSVRGYVPNIVFALTAGAITAGTALGVGPGAAILTGGIFAATGALWNFTCSSHDDLSKSARAAMVVGFALGAAGCFGFLATHPDYCPRSEYNEPYQSNRNNVLTQLFNEQKLARVTSDLVAPNHFTNEGVARFPVTGQFKGLSGSVMAVEINNRKEYYERVKRSDGRIDFKARAYSDYQNAK